MGLTKVSVTLDRHSYRAVCLGKVLKSLYYSVNENRYQYLK